MDEDVFLEFLKVKFYDGGKVKLEDSVEINEVRFVGKWIYLDKLLELVKSLISYF